MFIKDGPNTPVEDRISRISPGNIDKEEVKAAKLAFEEELRHMGDEDKITSDNLMEVSEEELMKQSKKEATAKKFIKEHVHPTKNKDDLLDIRVGNPLRRITELLEDIKKQKAFSFTLKGSLGIMGVALAVSTFGIFGGSKVLCDKGTQSHIGTVKQLAYVEEGDFPILTQMADAYSVLTGGRVSDKPATRLILIQQDNQAINLTIARSLDRGGPIPDWLSQKLKTQSSQLDDLKTFDLMTPSFIVTGPYDACSKTLKINQPTAIEVIK